MGKKRHYSHLSYEQRRQIEQMLAAGYNGMEIAVRLCVSESTVYREIRRGTIKGQYNALFSQSRYDEAKANKYGPAPKLAKNKQLATYIAAKILEEGMSPGRIAAELDQHESDGNTVTVNTIYKAIDDGNIPGVTRDTIRHRIIKMFSDGHLIIPAWIREKYNFVPGDRFVVSEESEERIVLTKIGIEGDNRC